MIRATTAWEIMKRFAGHDFVGCLAQLKNCQGMLVQLGDQNQLLAFGVAQFVEAIEQVLVHCRATGLGYAVRSGERLQNRLRQGFITLHQINEELGEFGQRIEDELEQQGFYQIANDKLAYFDKPDPFGAVVTARFQRAAFDIEEAGKCLALDRATATVFHLMRVMEIGVQEFGNALGLTLTSEKTWDQITSEINGAIKLLPHSTPSEKETVAHYAAASAHLFNVRVAWRNPVMHPKDKYTEEEAEDIFTHVKAFMRHLATVV